jgi:hypothetical protein
MAKTMETSRDNEHEVKVRDALRGRCVGRCVAAIIAAGLRQLPLDDEACPAWSSSSLSSNGASPRDVARMTATTEWGIHL